MLMNMENADGWMQSAGIINWLKMEQCQGILDLLWPFVLDYYSKESNSDSLNIHKSIQKF